MKSIGVDPVHDTRACYRRLVAATSRPGTVREVTPRPADRTVLATLVDGETALHTADDQVRDALAGEGRLVEAPLAEADVVHVAGSTGGEVTDARRGTLKEPSGGATVVYRVDAVRSEPQDELTTVTVSGPGVPGERACGLSLPVAEVEAIADAQSAYPRGVDVYATDGTRLVAFPRSVTIAAEEGA